MYRQREIRKDNLFLTSQSQKWHVQYYILRQNRPPPRNTGRFFWAEAAMTIVGCLRAASSRLCGVSRAPRTAPPQHASDRYARAAPRGAASISKSQPHVFEAERATKRRPRHAHTHSASLSIAHQPPGKNPRGKKSRQGQKRNKMILEIYI